MFDHDASSDLLSSRPSLYYVGSKGTLYRNWSFWVNILEALYVSLVVFFIAFGMPLFPTALFRIFNSDPDYFFYKKNELVVGLRFFAGDSSQIFYILSSSVVQCVL